MIRLFIFARPPRIGRGKRRLAAGAGEIAAWRFQRARLRALIRAFARMPGFSVTLLLEPHAPRGLSRLAEGLRLPTGAQARGGLGRRMAAAMRAPVAGRIFIMGADIPGAEPAALRRAARAAGDVVFGPAPDGGFWLAVAGPRARMRRCFLTHGRWSSPDALVDVLAALDRRDRVAFAETLDDVDEAAPARAMAAADSRRADLLTRLPIALDSAGHAGLAQPAPRLLPDKGLAHDHALLGDGRWLARMPKQSQVGLPPAENLERQAAIFARAEGAPALGGVLPVETFPPRGALIVEFVAGRPPRLPAEASALAAALARAHRPDPPPREARAPLPDPNDPLADLIAEIARQAAHIPDAALHPATRAAFDQTFAGLQQLAERAARPPKTLIAFDAHPGNFLIDKTGRAVLVDWEKARYGYPALDLAHATLHTSTTWDVETYGLLGPAQVAGVYAAWLTAMGPAGEAHRPWFAPLRRAMWLWSLSWCALWRATHAREADETAAGVDWSAALSEAALIRHVRGRVNHYLDPATVAWVLRDCRALEGRFGAP